MKKISVLFFGGLGNQLFQLALAKTLEFKYPNVKFDYIDLTRFEDIKRKWSLSELSIKRKKINKFSYLLLNIKRIINKKFPFIVIRILFFNVINESKYKYINKQPEKCNNLVFDGYWQSEKYFLENKKYLIDQFLKPRINLINQYKASRTVALHIRIGDYVHNKVSSQNHFVCDFNWYKKAINYLYEINNNFKFILYTDDYEYIKTNYIFDQKYQIIVPEVSDNDYINLMYMTYSDHFIISNSSYSWWASYLGESSESITIAPKYWYPNKLTSNIPIFRSNWILI
tara:strand:- start:541 stop:1395 length:855 start_codon:yes stop_codon:yes gene_type:complete